MADMAGMDITENIEDIGDMEDMEDLEDKLSYNSEVSLIDCTNPNDRLRSIEDAVDLAIGHLFPWVNHCSNVITRQVGKALKRAYLEESRSWSWEMSLEFRHTAPTLNFSVYAQTGSITSHIIGRKARNNGAAWVHFWFLRVMFGPRACSRQLWFADLVDKHPWMLDEAPGGVVPSNAYTIIKSGQEDWEPATPTTMERPDALAVARAKREAAESTSNPRPSKTPRASTPTPQPQEETAVEADIWAQLDAADFSEVPNARIPSKTDEELQGLKAKHEALQLAHETLWEKHKALEEKYRKQEEKLEKLCTGLVQLGNLVKHQNGV
ncbi:hypothetical protein A9Z42_0004260 [Trichoderma parareesei]|uniref:Uncharacterized protein n=1 Tax=Trichoderma parareesei TaxID=858221 RepID=A0A2H2ZVN3_TRIPA|nr:hypothetical protein A9Z42_0004260 [Trichoderma parareesei]